MNTHKQGKEYTANTLSEYISIIESNGLYDCISRGENALYPNPMCSGILRNKNKEHYAQYIEEFQYSVGAEITPLQQKHFLAFCQHHGIPTNLLDFSFSPLVSLFFAVSNSENEGYVYFLKKSKLADVGDLIIQNNYGWGMLNQFLDMDPKTIQSVMPQLSKTFSKNNIEMIDFFERHMAMFFEEWPFYRCVTLDSAGKETPCFDRICTLRQSFGTYLKDKSEWKDELSLQIKSSYSNFVNGFSDSYKDDIFYPRLLFENLKKRKYSSYLENAASVELIIILLKHMVLNRFFVRHEKYEIGEMEMPFYFSYRPPLVDNRIRNQSSIFIFQPFARDYFTTHGRKEVIRYWQRILPDFTIKIENPVQIMKELDAIGFNRKHIYCDYDSIAKYTVDSMNE